MIRDMTPIGVGGYISAGGTFVAATGGGDQGKGYQITYSGTNTANITSSATEPIAVPSSVRGISVTFQYVGASTTTFALQCSNNTRAEVAAGTATWGQHTLTGAFVSGTGTGSALTVSIIPAPLFIRGLVGGTGSAGTDTFVIAASAVATIRP